MSIDLTRFYDTFFSECFDLIDEAESLLLTIEKGEATADTLNAAFRSIHSIKGSAGSLGFDALAAFAHDFESALETLRDNNRQVLRSDADLLLSALDTLRVMLEAAKRKEPGIDESRLVALTQRLHAFTVAGEREQSDSGEHDQPRNDANSAAGFGEAGVADPGDDPQQSGHPYSSNPTHPPATASSRRFRIHFKPHLSALENGHDPIRYLIAIEQLGQARFTPMSGDLPDCESFDPRQAYLGWIIELETERSRAELLDLFEWIEDLCELEVADSELEVTASPWPPAAPFEAASGTHAHADAMRADSMRADAQRAEAMQAGAFRTEALQAAAHQAVSKQTVTARADPMPNAAAGSKLADTAPAAHATVRAAQINVPQPAASGAPATALPVATGHTSGSIHVKSERLDQLMNLLGEMLIAHSRVRALCHRLPEEAGYDILSELSALERSTGALQEVILSVRMVPIAALFGRFERLVRDAARSLGKEINLITDSHGAELDNGLVERMIDPLTHLIRNAIDHGLETPEERLSKAKPVAGRLELTAGYSAGRVFIEISDDGRGIDVDRVRTRAIERGLARADEAKTDQEWMRHIFQPGFSTANRVSTWSGRGVGLDIALNAVQSVGGQIVLDSKPDQGTTFRITLPLTTSILDALIVRVDGRRYAVPVASVQHCLRADAKALAQLPNGGQTYRFDGRYHSFARLAEVLGHQGLQSGIPDDSVALLVHAHAEPMILLVDAIEAQQQIVVKDVTHQSFRSPLTIGATVLGDGHVALILDLNAIESALIRRSRPAATIDRLESAHA